LYTAGTERGDQNEERNESRLHTCFFMASTWWQFKTWEGVRNENYTNHSEIRAEIDRKDHVLVGGPKLLPPL